jgi:hypothetical protein
MRFVEIAEARAARGLRLVIAGAVPSPWSQGAMGIFDLKKLDYVAVRFRPAADEVRAWTGSWNAPVAVFDDEPPRTGWAEILALAERLAPEPALVPDDGDARVRLFGLAHELLGERGLAWSVRLLMIHAGLTTDGREGWPVKVAAYLAPRYGYAPELVPAARARALAVLAQLTRVRDEPRDEYLLGPAPSALDVYAAVALGVVAPLPPEDCPMPAPVRHAFETVDAEVRAAVTPALLAHRALMYERRHLARPMRF